MKKIISLTVISILVFNIVSAQTALDFEDNLQSVELSGITCPNEFTFEALINRRGQGGFRTILEFGNDAPYFGTTNDNLTLYQAVTSIATIPLNQWIHVATTYSSTTMEAKLYINGVLDNTATGVTPNTVGVGAGIGQNFGDNVFGGSIDNVRIWDVVRTDAEILANIDTCLDGTETSLYAFYDFNEATGTLANDLTGNVNGTLINMDPATDWVTHDSCNTNTLSIEDYSINPEIRLFPNPASNVIQVSGLTNTEHYTIYTILGEQVSSGSISKNETLNIENLNNGIYFFKIKNRNTKKFVKQ